MNELQTYILYCFLIVISSVLMALSVKVKDRRLSITLIVTATLIPTLISGLRYGVGTDYFNYARIYRNLTESETFFYHIQNSRLEPSWLILNFIVKYTFDDVVFLFILSSLITFTTSIIAIYQNRKYINVGISTFILLSTMFNPSLNLVRLYIAASIVLLSIKPLINKQLWKFVIIIIIATTFHLSAIIFIIMYWVVNDKLEKTTNIKKILILVFTILSVVFSEYIFTFVTQFSLFSTFRRHNFGFRGFHRGVIIFDLPIILLIIININKLKLTFKPMYNIVIIYFIGQILGFLSFFAKYGGRITTYFDLIQIFIVSSIIRSQKNNKTKVTYIIIVACYYLGLYIYFYVLNNSHGTVPYSWIFGN